MQSSRHHEVEMKVLNIQPDELAAKILEQGGVEEGEYNLVDYFFDRGNKQLQGHGKTLRLRTSEDGVFLTYKGVVSNTRGLKVRKEYEVSVGDFDTTQTLLFALGYHLKKSIPKTRRVFHLNGVEIVFDFYGVIPPYAEFEGDDKESIEAVAHSLGIRFDYRVSHLGFNGIFKHYGVGNGYFRRDPYKEHKQKQEEIVFGKNFKFLKKTKKKKFIVNKPK